MGVSKDNRPVGRENEEEEHVTALAVGAGLTASLGGLVLGYCRCVLTY